MLQPSGELLEMNASEVSLEADLQELIAKYPSLIAGGQVDPESPRRWLLVSRELGIPAEEDGGGHWALDHLFLDQDGVPTLVEVKRRSDTRIRREVIGQMLDYAANFVAYLPADRIRARFEAGGEQAEQRLAGFLGAERDPDSFWQLVKTNLEAGRIRLLFVADEIPPELRRVVEFLNEQMDPAEVLAIEVRQYEAAGFKTIVPRVYGLTAEAERKKPFTARRVERWDEASFFSALGDRTSPEGVEAARSILEWTRALEAKGEGRVTWGTGLTTGSFKVTILDKVGNPHDPLMVYSYGRVEIQFQHLMNRAPFDSINTRAEVARRLSSILGVGISPERLDKRPSIELASLGGAVALRAFLEVLEHIKAQVRGG